jgi:bifunctional enzyme CysN/CysC
MGKVSMLSPSELSNQGRAKSDDQAGVIWVTGFSAAGKTTVCRQVERKLKSLGVNTVFLDGDDLRSIFGGHWGYDRAERIKLAHVYFRLCSHLASQGVTVIIAAVAMYSDVRKWIEKNIPRAIEVYLRVPEEERRRRDRVTKQVYDRIGNTDELYDVPSDPDLLFDNYGSTSLEQISDTIVDYYRSNLMPEDADHGRAEHWQTFYNTTTGSLSPSPYATTVASKLTSRSKILEVGCGNGRDASFFQARDTASWRWTCLTPPSPSAAKPTHSFRLTSSPGASLCCRLNMQA